MWVGLREFGSKLRASGVADHWREQLPKGVWLHWFEFVPGGAIMLTVSTKAAARGYMYLGLIGLDPGGTHPPTPRRPDQ
jgi:hypothetical protein